jgi:hypothetical protein
MKYCILIWFCLFSFQTIAQISNEFAQSSNPMYWKNRKPYEGYWQQDVHYIIHASINEHTQIISGSEELHYTNNSPDTLNEVYFHLYQNAFVKGSYLDELHKVNKKPIRRRGKYQEAGLGTEVSDWSVNGVKVNYTLDNTILKIELPTPLLPNSTATFLCTFKTYFDRGEHRRRMALGNYFGFPTYNGVHWYPRISVYDKKKGWDTDQHLNKELYGDYGQFDVSLEFASNYIVEATGNLVNEEEVLPPALRQKLDIKNFANKPWNEKPSIIIPYDSNERKTWRYHAINVHDFAFTANPYYRLGEVTWNGVRCIAIAKEPHCSKWQNAPQYVARIIQTFSEDFGMYEYPKMVAADADDGMEYPMITMDGGADPDYRGLLVHEIGHNWFYGMIGNNETYRAALDEGFTQFLTAWGLRKIDGEVMVQTPPKNKFVRKRKDPAVVIDRSVYNRYMFDAVRGEDKMLNTHSNDFHSAIGHENGYSNVYHKTASMLYNLQYVLGDDLFLRAMQHYVSQWKIAHPYFEDFRASIIEYTHQDLNWFFDQWMETTKRTDYRIRSIKKGYKEDSYKITLQRKGDMQMPIDFTVTARDGKKYNYHIPNTYFQKKTEATVLPKWYGWDLLFPTYTAKITIPKGIRSVQLDTTNRLADVYMPNNYKRPRSLFTPEAVDLRFENYIQNPPNWKKYQVRWRPDIWWNAYDGIKAGLHADGSFMNYSNKFYATVWYNTRALVRDEYAPYDDEGWHENSSPLDYTFRFETPLRKINPKINWGLQSRWMDGFGKHGLHWDYAPTNKQNIRAEIVTQYRGAGITNAYLFAPKEWSSYWNFDQGGRANTYVQVGYKKWYQEPKQSGQFQFTLRTPITYSYAYLQGEWLHKFKVDRLECKTRAFARYGWGDDLPTESALYMQGANPEELMENKFTRSQGVFPKQWGNNTVEGFSNVHGGGGLNLRGYTGYYAVDEENGTLYINYKSRSGAAVNMEVDFDQYFRKLRPKIIRDFIHIDLYAFADAGIVQRGTLVPTQLTQLVPTSSWSKIRMDAGFGTALTVKRLPVLETVKPFTVRVDFPLFLSSPPFDKNKNIDFRWVIGIERAF